MESLHSFWLYAFMTVATLLLVAGVGFDIYNISTIRKVLKRTEIHENLLKAIQPQIATLVEDIALIKLNLNTVEDLLKNRSLMDSIIEVKQNTAYCIMLNSKDKNAIDEESVNQVQKYFREKGAEVLVVVSDF